jgi:putative thioredoxin
VTDYIVNIDASNAAALLIDESHKRPVVADFWSDRSAPSKALTPLLEKIATEYQGAFLLARVNADQQPGIAQQLGVRNLPTVMVIQDGRPVDGFAGAQSEPAVRKLLEKYLPKPWDALLQQGLEAMERGEYSNALTPLRQAWIDSRKQHNITLTYAHALIECLRLDEAEAVLDEVRLAHRDAAYEQLRAQVGIRREAAKSPEIQALEQQLAASPDDLNVRYQLGVQYTNNKQFREGMEHLIAILRKDLNHADGATKRMLLDTIALLGKGDPLAAEYQRKLYSLLY